MKLYSQALELRTIKSMAVAASSEEQVSDVSVSDSLSISTFLLASTDESFFHYAPSKAAFARLQTISEKRSKIISYEDLIEDPALNEEYRDVLQAAKGKRVRTMEEAVELLDGLDNYRKTRSLYFMAKSILDTLKQPEVDIQQLLDNVTDQLTSTRSRESVTDMMLTVGKDANALDLVDQALSMEDEHLLKTGIKEFDERNGGITSEGVWLLAATTSGGKSVARMNLMKNMYLLNNVSVCTVSLEMNAKKETRRLLSNLTKIPFWKFIKKRLSDEEKATCKKSWRRFSRHGREGGARYSIMCPTRSVSIQQLLLLVKPYKFKVVAIDYISLLEGVDGADQHKVLSAITRECKVFSAENKCLVILLAQLDSDDDRIRYSKGILEHVDNCWIWNYSKPEQRELKTIPVQQKKARDQELFSFDIAERFEVMTIQNMDDPDQEYEQDHGGTSSIAVQKDDPLSEEKVTYDVE